VRNARIAFVVALVAGVADARVVRPPGLQRSCRGPSTWSELVKCAKPFVDTALPTRPPSTVVILQDRTDPWRKHAFANLGDGRWALAASLAAGDYEIVGHQKAKAGAEMIDRIDLFGHQQTARDTTLHRKIALLCNHNGCTQLTYACTAIVRGKAVETFAGDVKIESNGALIVVGDRSQSGTLCP
jgi:hypothetical protein